MKMQTPRAFQIEAMETDKPSSDPEKIRDEQRWPFGSAAFALALDQIPGDEWKYDQRTPIQPMG